MSLLLIPVATLRAEVRHLAVADRLSPPDPGRGRYGAAVCGATPVFTQERITTVMITDLPLCLGCYPTYAAVRGE